MFSPHQAHLFGFIHVGGQRPGYRQHTASRGVTLKTQKSGLETLVLFLYCYELYK